MTQKIALITGAARGIGAATAKVLAAHGYAVCIGYRASKKEAEALAGSLPGAIAVQANVQHEGHIIKLFDTVQEKLGTPTALVNNAGLSGNRIPFEKIIYDDITQVFAANVYGTMLCCREALKRMKPGGAIVNVSSMAATFGGNQLSVYAASKAAINGFTIGLAREAAAKQIRVNAVAPAIIDTEQNAGLAKEKIDQLPMGRMGAAAEVAEAIAWLLSDAASYVSGSILPITGAR